MAWGAVGPGTRAATHGLCVQGQLALPRNARGTSLGPQGPEEPQTATGDLRFQLCNLGQATPPTLSLLGSVTPTPKLLRMQGKCTTCMHSPGPAGSPSLPCLAGTRGSV